MTAKTTLITGVILLAGIAVFFLYPDAGVPQQASTPSSDATVVLTETPVNVTTPDTGTTNEHIEKTEYSRISPALEPEIRAALASMLNTSDQGLVEEPMTGGGTKVNLQGRFRTVPVATILPNGDAVVIDYTQPPVEPQQ